MGTVPKLEYVHFVPVFVLGILAGIVTARARGWVIAASHRIRIRSLMVIHRQRDSSELDVALGSALRGVKLLVGVDVYHPRSGVRGGVNPTMPMPMASLAKLPIVTSALQRLIVADEASRRIVEVLPEDAVSGSGVLHLLRAEPHVSLTPLTLAELAVTVSDNTAADILWRLGGGAVAVNRWLKSLQLSGIRVDRSMAELIRDFDAGENGFVLDPRDTATARSFNNMLVAMQDEQVSGQMATELILAAMERCATGENRIRGALGSGVRVRHKSGTLGAVVNDAGLVQLGDGSWFAITVLTAGTGHDAPDAEEAEHAIRQLAVTAYQFLNDAGPTHRIQAGR